MKQDDLDNLNLVWRAFNLALPMAWLIAVAVWGYVARTL